jgi:hypothetical protein
MLHKDLAEFRETRPPETESPPHTLVPCQTFSQLIGEVPTLATGKNASLLRRPASLPADMICRRGQFLISLNCVFDASLVPETCLEPLSLPVCCLDSIRQAKADIRHGASCPTVSMAPVLAITSVVARTAL